MGGGGGRKGTQYNICVNLLKYDVVLKVYPPGIWIQICPPPSLFFCLLTLFIHRSRLLKPAGAECACSVGLGAGELCGERGERKMPGLGKKERKKKEITCSAGIFPVLLVFLFPPFSSSLHPRVSA